MRNFILSFNKPEIPKFMLGNTVTTQGARAALTHEEMLHALKRHLLGDWGDLEPEDKSANERALREEGRLVSVYNSTSGIRFYIITEADRSYTTILLPEEY